MVMKVPRLLWNIVGTLSTNQVTGLWLIVKASRAKMPQVELAGPGPSVRLATAMLAATIVVLETISISLLRDSVTSLVTCWSGLLGIRILLQFVVLHVAVF